MSAVMSIRSCGQHLQERREQQPDKALVVAMMELVQVWNLAWLQAIDAVQIAPISGAHSTPTAFDALYSMYGDRGAAQRRDDSP